MKILFPLLFITVVSASCANENQEKKKTDSIICIVPPPTFDPQSEKETIRQLENKYAKFLTSGNGDSLLDLYSDDIQILANQQTIFTGKQGVKTYCSYMPEITFEQRIMVSLNGTKDVLYESGIETLSGKRGSQSFGGNRKYLTIWKLVNGKYKIAVEMWNELPPQAINSK
ncbi:MAG: nuclear transport factor 2 family protein [Bacteroidetes bacterium]|nr:nuclear transport factor 2 family protein [Bacteroidota bacterium]